MSFEEAKSVFDDPEALLIADPENSETEDRLVILGISKSLKLLVVCHYYRGDDEIIRIISARKATKSETLQYRRGSYA